MTFRALSRTAFEEALIKGMGKAFRHVETHHDDGFEDVILKACLKNPVYDRQCNGGRGKWMMALLSHTRNPQDYYDKIIDALALAEDDDAAHLADLCLELALSGNLDANSALYAKFTSDIENYQYISHHIVDLNGIEGLIFSASHIGRYLAENPEYHEDNWFLSHYSDKLGKDKVREAITSAAIIDAGMRAYIDRVVQTDGYLFMSDEPETETQHLSTQDYIHLVQTDPSKARFNGIGVARRASDDDIQNLFAALIAADDPAQQRLYLRCFKFRALPELHPKIFELALSDDLSLRLAAIRALSNISDPRIRAFAEPRLANKDWPMLECLTHNFKDGDTPWILGLIDEVSDPDDIHNIGLDLLNICDQVSAENAAPLLLWTYNRTPCSMCRDSSVNHLSSLNALSAEIAAEFEYDCAHDRYDS